MGQLSLGFLGVTRNRRSWRSVDSPKRAAVAQTQLAAGAFPGQACIGQFIKLHHIASSTAFGENWLFEGGHMSKRDLSTMDLGVF